METLILIAAVVLLNTGMDIQRKHWRKTRRKDEKNEYAKS